MVEEQLESPPAHPWMSSQTGGGETKKQDKTATRGRAHASSHGGGRRREALVYERFEDAEQLGGGGEKLCY